MIKHEATNIARFLGEGTKGSKFQPKRGNSAFSLLTGWNLEPFPENTLDLYMHRKFLRVFTSK